MIKILEDPARRNELENYVDTFYNVLHLMIDMKTPVISFMDGVTSTKKKIFNLFNVFFASGKWLQL